MLAGYASGEFCMSRRYQLKTNDRKLGTGKGVIKEFSKYKQTENYHHVMFSRAFLSTSLGETNHKCLYEHAAEACFSWLPGRCNSFSLKLMTFPCLQLRGRFAKKNEERTD